MVFGTVLVYGIYRNGVKFLKLFVPSGIPIYILPLIVFIEVLSFLSRPITLSVRLFANMTAGHIVLLAIISLIFVFGSYAIALGPVLMAVAITFLELFVSFLQAFIFAVLTSVFIGLVRHAH